MSVLERLAASPGVFWGEGQGPDRGGYTVRMAVQAESDGSVTLDYESWAPHVGLHHAEAARMYRTDHGVVLVATSTGGDPLTFREGDAGVFGSTGGYRVGLVLDVRSGDVLTLEWWWPTADGTLRQQSSAVVRLSRPVIAAPPLPEGCAGRGGVTHRSAGAADGNGAVPNRNGGVADKSVAGVGSAHGDEVPWPGILVLDGKGTGVVAQRLAERLTRAAVLRTDLFDQAVRGIDARPDPALREQVAVAVVRAYAGAAHPVILHGRSPSSEQRRLVDALGRAGLRPVRLVEVADGESYGEVARRLIEAD